MIFRYQRRVASFVALTLSVKKNFKVNYIIFLINSYRKIIELTTQVLGTIIFRRTTCSLIVIIQRTYVHTYMHTYIPIGYLMTSHFFWPLHSRIWGVGRSGFQKCGGQDPRPPVGDAPADDRENWHAVCSIVLNLFVYYCILRCCCFYPREFTFNWAAACW